MTGVLDLARPYLWLALIAFAIGFLSYLVLGAAPPAAAREEAARPAPATAPMSDAWNVPRRI